MGEDLSTGIKIAIVLILLASIVASVFSIMAISKNMTNSGVNQLQSSLHAFQNMRWEDYNLRTVTGNEVQVVIRSAIDNDIAVIVNTQRKGSESVLYGIPLDGFTKSTSGSAFYVGKCSNGGKTTSQFKELCSNTSCAVYFDNSKSCFVGDHIEDNQDGSASKEYGSYTKNINDNTSAYYIDPMLKFNSYIIRDASGSLLGVLFDEKVS